MKANLDCYDPNAAPWRDDPHPALEHARRERPVFRCPAQDAWVVTRYDDVAAVAADPARFSSADVLRRVGTLCPEAHAVLAGGYNPAELRSLITLDPPDHGRIRRVVASAFTPRRVAGLEPRVRAIAEELVDGFAADGEVDLITRFAYPLPLAVIMELLEVPRADWETIKRWGDDRIALVWGELSDEEQVRCARSSREFHAYLGALVDERRAHPGDDFVSDLVTTVTADGRALDRVELIGQLATVMSAGHETTTNLIAVAVVELLADRPQWDALCADPALAAAAVEETLRFDGPAKGVPRTAAVDVELSGVTIRAGERVLAMLSSANRDEAVFADAGRFDILRPRPEQAHMAFGRGPHFCAGAALGRLEGRVALEVLSRRLPGLRLVPGAPLRFKPNTVIRALRELPLRWETEPAADDYPVAV